LQKVLFDRYNIWPLIAGVFVINWIFLFGFLTYLLGVGFFLWGIAAWISLSCKSSRYRILYGSLFAIGLFFTHLVAFGLYAVAVFGFELQRALMSMRGGDGRSPLSAMGTMAFSGIQFVVPVVLYFLSPTRNTGLVEGVGGSIHYEFAKKLATPLVTLTSGIPWLDILLGVTVLVSALLVLFYARIRLSADLVGPAMCMILAFLALPHIMRPAAFVDSRIPIAILFFLIGGVQISFRKGSAGVALIAIISSFFVVKTAAVTKEWWEHDALINEYFDAFDRMEDSGTMFAAMQDVAPSWTRKHYLWRVTSPMHVADLATLTGRVFAPTVFAVSGQHTIAVRERFAEMTAYQSVEPIRFGNPEELTRVIEDLLDLHLQASPDRPAYLLLLDRGRVPMPLVDGSRLIASGRGFRLIQIYEPGDGQGSPRAGRRG